MKRQLATALLFAVAFGTFQLPARADFNVAFGRHDYNHDGRWDYNEFHQANRYYHHHHPGVVVLDNRDEFNRLDVNHDGYLTGPEIQTYRTWD
jgi:hypothetical protein